MPGFLSSRLNWVHLPPPLQASVAPPQLSPRGRDTLACEGGGALLEGSNVRLNWNIESDMNVHWIKFKKILSLY